MDVTRQRLAVFAAMPPQEQLRTAAKWAVGDFQIIMNSHGGLVNRDFELMMDLLGKAVEATKPPAPPAAEEPAA